MQVFCRVWGRTSRRDTFASSSSTGPGVRGVRLCRSRIRDVGEDCRGQALSRTRDGGSRSPAVLKALVTATCDLQSPITNLQPTMFFSLVLPTLNEARNLARMVGAVQAVLSGLEYEVIIADDKSPDGTGRIADELAAADAHIRVVHRTTRPGLSPSVVDGWRTARGDVLAVMDADLQHPPEVIGAVATAVQEGADLAIASRYVTGGEIPAWAFHRRFMSLLGTAAVRVALGA